MRFAFFVSRRYLRAKHKNAFVSFITILSIAGVTVGVMALIIVIGVMSGAETYFKTKILGVEPHVIIRKHGGPITDFKRVISVAESIEGVESAFPVAETQAMIRSASGASGAVIRGVDPSYPGCRIMGAKEADVVKYLSCSRNRKAGSKDGNRIKPGIMMGADLAARLGVVPGDVVYIISPQGILSPIGRIPGMKRFVVSGLFSSGFYEYDASIAYISLCDAQKLLKIGDAATAVGVKVADIYDAREIAGKLEAILGFPYVTMDWMTLNRNFFAALKLEKEAMFVILTLIILVAAFNIASTLIMMVMGKTRDIAILKAMGATESHVRRIFVLSGMIIGTAGTALGAMLGIIGCVVLKHYKFIKLPGDVYYFSSLPVDLHWTDVSVIVLAALAICFLSTLYPASRAAKLNPVEAFRYG